MCNLEFLRNILINLNVGLNLAYDRCFFRQKARCKTDKGEFNYTKECLVYSNFRAHNFSLNSITHSIQECSSLVKYIRGCTDCYAGTPSFLQCCFDLVKKVLVRPFTKTLTTNQRSLVDAFADRKKVEIAEKLQAALVKFNELHGHNCRSSTRCYDERGNEIECPENCSSNSVISYEQIVDKKCLEPIVIGVSASGQSLHPILRSFISLTGFKLQETVDVDVSQNLNLMPSGGSGACVLTNNGTTGAGLIDNFLAYNNASSGSCGSGGGKVVGFRSLLEALKY